MHIANCLRGGGLQNFLVSLLSEQSNNGHDVYLVVVERYDYDYCQYLEDKLTNNRVKVIRLNKNRGSKVSLIRTIFKCRKIVSECSPDIINTHGGMSHVYGALCVLRKSIPHVLTIHNAPEIWPLYIKKLCKNRPLIFCSQSAYDMRVQESYMMATIDNGISRDIVCSNNIVDLRKEIGLSNNDKVIVLVGSLRLQKNYEFLKKIVDCSNEPSWHFCICGGNYGYGYVSPSVFKGYERNIHLLGLRSDVSAIENGADLFLSCATFEGLPIAVLEAYFNGIPCVLSPIPQHRNIGNVSYVWIPNDFNPESFVISIKNALNNRKNPDFIYESRKKQIEKYSISLTCKKYLAFYQRILNEK